MILMAMPVRPSEAKRLTCSNSEALQLSYPMRASAHALVTRHILMRFSGSPCGPFLTANRANRILRLYSIGPVLFNFEGVSSNRDLHQVIDVSTVVVIETPYFEPNLSQFGGPLGVA